MQVTPRSSLMIHFTFPSYVLESFPRMPLFMPCPALSCMPAPFLPNLDTLCPVPSVVYGWGGGGVYVRASFPVRRAMMVMVVMHMDSRRK